jgi:mycothiol synthase
MATTMNDCTMRPPADADAAPVSNLLNEVMAHDRGTGTETEEKIRSGWASPGFDLATDARVVLAPSGEMVGYIEFWDSPPHTASWAWGGVHPAFRGRGIGGSLLDWVDQRVQASLDAAPDGERIVHRTGAFGSNDAARRLFQVRQYALARRFWRMEIAFDAADSLPEPAWPEGITLRTFVPGQDDHAVYEAYNDAFQEHWGYQEASLEQWLHKFAGTPNYDPALWLLAVTSEAEGEQIAGLVICSPQSSEDLAAGGIREVAVRRPWRRQGIARALLYQAFRAFQARGVYRVGLGVDADNESGATRLYESAGMSPVRSWDIFEKVIRDAEESGSGAAASQRRSS